MDNVNILLTCPNCGNSTWVKVENGFECLACGDTYETEEMCSEVKPAPKQVLRYTEIIPLLDSHNLTAIQPMIVKEVEAKTTDIADEVFEAICRDVFKLCQNSIETPVISDAVDTILREKYPVEVQKWQV